ncbi:MAG: glycosyltransferase family 4 protein [Deltaproteobacteria bacterium]|nr:glycosyltransferase family 4 protein [Deltaproteobacteria bacterium]
MNRTQSFPDEKKVRILILCFWAHGSCYYTVKYCNALAARGMEVHLVAPGNFMYDLLSPQIKCEQWPYDAPEKLTLRALLKTPFQALRVIGLVRSVRPDWIHLLWPHHVPIFLGWLLKQHNFAYTVHDPVLHSGESGNLRSFVQKKLIYLADICFVHGQKNKRDLEKGYGVSPERVFSIPHGAFRFWNDLPNVQKENMVLFFGRIRQYKGFDVLLEAFEIVTREIPSLRLCICGKGNMDALWPRIKTLSNVEVVNRFIEHDEIPEFFLRSMFLVLPYTEATQSGVIPMAFALGRTCIATKVGAIPEVVRHGENGILVRPSDPDELAGAILSLAQDKKELMRLQENAQRSADLSGALSWDRAAEIAAGVYTA